MLWRFCLRLGSGHTLVLSGLYDTADQVGGANGDEPFSSVSIATSAAAHPRRSPRSLAAIAMLCAKCHQKEATIHFTTVVDGTEEAVHLCKDCAPPTGFDLDKLDLKQIEALWVIGKKCEFCGGGAFSGQMSAKGGAIYWCFD